MRAPSRIDRGPRLLGVIALRGVDSAPTSCVFLSVPRWWVVTHDGFVPPPGAGARSDPEEHPLRGVKPSGSRIVKRYRHSPSTSRARRLPFDGPLVFRVPPADYSAGFTVVPRSLPPEPPLDRSSFFSFGRPSQRRRAGSPRRRHCSGDVRCDPVRPWDLPPLPRGCVGGASIVGSHSAFGSARALAWPSSGAAAAGCAPVA